jgi:large subunit ribosomal protein L6
MSRIGKQPVVIPEGVEVSLKDNTITTKGKLGTLDFTFLKNEVEVKIENNEIIVSPKTEKSAAFWGTTRSVINNMVE